VAACGANGGLCQVCNGSQQCTSGQCVNPGCPGCVDGTGACQPGNTNAACGQGGNSCATCGGTAQCTNNQCVTPTCHGCVDGSGTCQPGNTNAACGANGIACQSCTGTAQCTNNQCITPTCNGCLDGNGVCQPGNTNAACGTAGEHCLVCTGQQQCNGSGQCIVPTCNGCVDGTGTCQPGTTNGACGLGGGSCTTCTAQHQCTNGVCVNTCTGCVDGTGTCQPGNTNGACGNLGAACTACTGNTTCVGGGCQVNSDGGTFTCTTTETYASCGGSCGVERWGAKVLTDAPSANVNMTPQLTTVAQLVTLPKVTPGSNDPRGGPNGTYTPEFNTYLIRNANMSIIKSESDLDYHLVLADPQSSGTTMIGEIPCPNCANGSKYQCFFTRARHALEAKFGAPPSISGTTPVSLIGAAFYDPPHGQTGAAPNNLEIHSIMAICFTTDCDPTAD
jgi:hypothetical protein